MSLRPQNPPPLPIPPMDTWEKKDNDTNNNPTILLLPSLDLDQFMKETETYKIQNKQDNDVDIEMDEQKSASVIEKGKESDETNDKASISNIKFENLKQEELEKHAMVLGMIDIDTNIIDTNNIDTNDNDNDNDNNNNNININNNNDNDINTEQLKQILAFKELEIEVLTKRNLLMMGMLANSVRMLFSFDQDIVKKVRSQIVTEEIMAQTQLNQPMSNLTMKVIKQINQTIENAIENNIYNINDIVSGKININSGNGNI